MKNSIEGNERLEYIDVIKGIAIAMVILSHFTARLPKLNMGLAYLGAFGQMGCQMFFVISAFLAMKSLEHNSESFLKRKLERLLPEFYVAMAVHIFVIIILRDIVGVEMNFARTDIINIIANIFFIPRLGGIGNTNDLVVGSWYVFVLLIFYVVILYLFKNRKINSQNINYWFFTSMMISFFSVLVYYVVKGTTIRNNDYLYGSIFIQFPVLICGVKLYYTYLENKAIDMKRAICLAIICGTMSFIMFSSGIESFLVIIPTLCGIATYNLLVVQKEKSQTKQKTGGNCWKILKIMGDYSYEIFFMHIYPASYGVRVIRVAIERMGYTLNGTELFCLLIVPVYVASVVMAVIFRKVMSLIRSGKIGIYKEKYRG